MDWQPTDHPQRTPSSPLLPMEEEASPILTLPDELLLNIFSHLSALDLQRTGLTCSLWKALSQDHSLPFAWLRQSRVLDSLSPKTADSAQSRAYIPSIGACRGMFALIKASQLKAGETDFILNKTLTCKSDISLYDFKQGVTSLIQAFLPINQRWKDSSLTFQPSIHSDFFVDPERLAQRNGNALSKSESIDWQAFPNKECTQFGPKGYAVYTLPELIYYRAGSSPIPMALPHHYSLCPISDRLKRQTLLTHQTWALSSDALYLLCQKAKNTPFTLCRYSLENGQLEKKIPLSIIGSQLNQLRANEHLVAFATSEQKIHLYDQELIPLQALHLTDLFPPERAIKGFSEFSLHGDHLIVVSQAFKEISIWHLEKKLVRCLPLTGKTLNAFQAAGPFLALALDHRHIELFDLQTGNLLARLTLSEKMWDTGPWQQGSCWQAPFLFKEEEGQMSLAVLLESGRLEAWSSHL